ncbi:hypothetical protein OC834_002445 [Tilletia horrida]|nr:hypothetical protein OC834_002445 [Tilletia horrida]
MRVCLPAALTVLASCVRSALSADASAPSLQPAPRQGEATTIKCAKYHTHSGTPYWYTGAASYYYVDTTVIVRDSQGLQALPINRKKPYPGAVDTPSLVFYACSSTYMGWQTTSGSLNPSQTYKDIYGQLRVKGGRCVTVPELYSTFHQPLVLDTCHTDEDENLLSQWFHLRIVRDVPYGYGPSYQTNQFFFVGAQASNASAASYLLANRTLNLRETVQVVYKPFGVAQPRTGLFTK